MWHFNRIGSARIPALLLSTGLWGRKWPKGEANAWMGHMLQKSPACASISIRLPANETKSKLLCQRLLPCKGAPHAWRISKGEPHPHS